MAVLRCTWFDQFFWKSRYIPGISSSSSVVDYLTLSMGTLLFIHLCENFLSFCRTIPILVANFPLELRYRFYKEAHVVWIKLVFNISPLCFPWPYDANMILDYKIQFADNCSDLCGTTRSGTVWIHQEG